LSTPALTLTVAVVSETGAARDTNEDAAYAGDRLFAVAGGTAGDEAASAAVITALAGHDQPQRPSALIGAMRSAVTGAVTGPGATLTAMLCSGPVAVLAHTGGSRGFLLRAGRLRLVTEGHDERRYLTRFIDERPGRAADLMLRDLRPGDRWLLCSDGLCAVVPAAAIGRVLTAAGTPAGAAAGLAAAARDAGALDNITAVVVDVTAGAAA
jgi:serine/threonine protein phosphatase PrpC